MVRIDKLVPLILFCMVTKLRTKAGSPVGLTFGSDGRWGTIGLMLGRIESTFLFVWTKRTCRDLLYSWKEKNIFSNYVGVSWNVIPLGGMDILMRSNCFYASDGAKIFEAIPDSEIMTKLNAGWDEQLVSCLQNFVMYETSLIMKGSIFYSWLLEIVQQRIDIWWFDERLNVLWLFLCSIHEWNIYTLWMQAA